MAGIFGVCVATAGVLTLGTLTYHRNADYQSDLSIWQDTVHKAPCNARAHYNLGVALADRGQVEEAIAHYQRAVEIKPDDVLAHNNLGIALAGSADRFDEAIAQFQQVLEIKPDFAEAHCNLGNALAGRGQVEEAIACYRKALKIKPDFAEAHNNLGNALATQGQFDEAMEHYRQTLKIKPGYAEAHNNLGTVLAVRGRLAEAVQQYRQALEIKPDYAEAYNNLRSALADVIRSYRKVLQVKPDNVVAANNLAWLLATCPVASLRNGAKAVKLAQRAVQLSGEQSRRSSAHWLRPMPKQITFPRPCKPPARPLSWLHKKTTRPGGRLAGTNRPVRSRKPLSSDVVSFSPAPAKTVTAPSRTNAAGSGFPPCWATFLAVEGIRSPSLGGRAAIA